MPSQTTKFRIPYPLPADALVDYPALGLNLAQVLEAALVGAPPLRTAYAAPGAGTYPVPTAAIALIFEAIGGGGAGGGCAATAAAQYALGGGGGGAAFASRLIASPLPASYAYVVGAGGAGALGANGNPGGLSTIAGLSAANGQGGSAGAAAAIPAVGAGGGNAGIAGGTADFVVAGEDGQRGYALTGSAGGGLAGKGGHAGRGGGGASPVWTNFSNGNVGRAPGGGGSGATNSASGPAAMTGGAGAAGLIVVTALFGALTPAQAAALEIRRELESRRPSVELPGGYDELTVDQLEAFYAPLYAASIEVDELCAEHEAAAAEAVAAELEDLAR